MSYRPDNLEQLRRTFVADRSSVRWVQEDQLVVIDNVVAWRPQRIAAPPTIAVLAGVETP